MARNNAPRQNRSWIAFGAVVIALVVLLYAGITWWAYEDERGTPMGEIDTYETPVSTDNPPAAQ